MNQETLEVFLTRKGYTVRRRGPLLYVLFSWGTLEIQGCRNLILLLRRGEDHPPIPLPPTRSLLLERLQELDRKWSANRFADREVPR